ncbi:MAG: dihydrofolate reductase family protein [Nanoarchaeota archaeon]
MKVILLMACTVNGIIARENFSEDFLLQANFTDFKELAEKVGCFIVGRKTYEEVKKWKTNFDTITATKIVISRKKLKIDDDFICVSSPQKSLEKAAQLGFKKIVLTGGSKINSSFMKEHLIDEIILNINPYVLGNGIPLFTNDIFESKLKLMNVKKMHEGIVQLYYKVVK